MRFAFWYYIGKFTIIGLCLTLISFVISSKIPVIYEYFFAPIGIIVGVTFLVLGVTGAILAIMGIFGKTPQMYCPFCGKPGALDYQKYSSYKEHSGLLLYCDRCGVIHGTGFLGLRLEKSSQPETTGPSIKQH